MALAAPQSDVRLLCKYCGASKRETEFEVCKVLDNKVYRRNKCSQCKAERARQRRREVRAWVHSLKQGLACSRCGFGDYRALEFHHPGRGGKERNVADMVKDGRSVAVIEREINKCVVLCANCHRIEHYVEPAED